MLVHRAVGQAKHYWQVKILVLSSVSAALKVSFCELAAPKPEGSAMGVLVSPHTVSPHSLCPGEDEPDEGLLQEASRTFISVLSESEAFTWADKWRLK